MIEEALKIPPNWVEIRLGDIIELAYGKGLPEESRNTGGKYPVYGSNGIVGYHNQCLITGPAIIVGRKGAAGIPTYAKEDCWPIDTTYFIQPSNVYDLQFVYYLIRHLRLDRFDRSTAIPGLNRDDAYTLRIGLPPLNEQKRIVAKIEELFSELDKEIESLKTAREQLKVYRQAILKHAFEGKLTAHWRDQNKDKLETADQLLERIKGERDKWLAAEVGKGSNEAKRLLNKLREFTFNKPAKKLPQGWQWTSFTEALQVVVDCHNKTAPYEDSGIYLVRTSNIREGKINLNNDIRFVSESTYKFWSRRCPPESGDILFSREAPMGEAAIIPYNIKVCMGQRIMLLRSFNQLLNTKYLLYSILSPEFQSMMMKSAIGTGVKHLRVGDVEKLVFPICSPQEQGEIVRYLDRKFSAIEVLEQDIEQNLQKSEALRQSILKKAFSGKLVAQDPNDEPASVLLERIRAEKEAQKAESNKPKAKRNAA